MRLVLPITFVIVMAICGTGACAAPNEGVEPGSPVDVAYASAMTADELAKSKKQETAYGWKLEFVGERARFFACTDERTCGERLVDVPARSVVATQRIGRVQPSRADGTALEETDVLRLTLAKDTGTTRGGVASDPQRGLTVAMPPKH